MRADHTSAETAAGALASELRLSQADLNTLASELEAERELSARLRESLTASRGEAAEALSRLAESEKSAAHHKEASERKDDNIAEVRVF
jgi:hypothetical protein